MADGLRFANGINKSADGEHIYVAETTGREIRTYTRNIFGGDLTPAGQLPIASGLDNIAMSADGGMCMSRATPNSSISLSIATSRTSPRWSQVSAIRNRCKRGSRKARSSSTPAAGIGAASVGLFVRDRLSDRVGIRVEDIELRVVR